MAITKPFLKSLGWGSVLNAALDVIDGRLINMEAATNEVLTGRLSVAELANTIEDQLVDLGYSETLFNPTGLDGWRTALAGRANDRANILLVGDSIFEGVGATSYDTRLPEKLQSTFRIFKPIAAAQGPGYKPATNFSGHGSPPGMTATYYPNTSVDYGLGRKALGITDVGTVTYTFTGTRIRVWYGWNNDFSTSSANLVLDGGAPVVLPISPDTTPGSGQYWDSGPISAGNHTITFTGTAAFPLWLEGVEVFASADDVTKGVHVYDGAHGGLTSGNFLPTVAGGGRMWQAADLVEPNLTVINLGTNDTAFDVPSETLKENLQAIITRANAAAGAKPHSVLLIMPYLSIRTDPQHTSQLIAYRQKIRELAGANVTVLDLQAYWPVLVAGQGIESGVMFEDDTPVHPNQNGHDLMVSILSNILLSVPLDAADAVIQPFATATTAQLTSVSSTINTTAKYAGKCVLNTTNNTIVAATGSLTTSTWVTGGAVAHTPV